jgi:mRNA interferase RelE/StbE
MKSYEIQFQPSTRRDLRQISPDNISRILSALVNEPLSPQVIKLKGGDQQLYRIRIGDYRVVYGVDVPSGYILVYHIKHRQEVYRDLSFAQKDVITAHLLTDSQNEQVREAFVSPSINGWKASKIQTLVKNIYERGYDKRFNPRIYNKLGIEVDERQWIEIISMLVLSGKATEQLELSCPNCHEVISSYLKYQDIPLGQNISCIHCTHDFEVSEEHIIPMYSFMENFDLTQNLSELEKSSGILAKKD